LRILTLIRVPLQETWEEAAYAEVKDVRILLIQDFRGALLQGVAENHEHLKMVEAYALLIHDIM
jgi:hypothetical protein